MNNLEVFNQVRSDLSALVEKNKGLVINGIDDVDGYIKVKEAKNETRKAEIDLEKLAKSEREGALNYQRGIISLEKDLKDITSPLIANYTKQLDTIDKLKAREERKVLLADRLGKLNDIGVILSDDEVLDLDEKQWAEFYSQRKMNYLEDKETERLALENERLAKERADKAEVDRIEREKLKAENDKLQADIDISNAEIQRLAKEKKDKEDADDLEAQKILNEEAERKAKLKGEKYDAFLKECGMTEESAKDEFFICDTPLPDGSTRVTVYKKVNSIIL
jgi:hypothetical protein